jgi:hypothetical protein
MHVLRLYSRDPLTCAPIPSESAVKLTIGRGT